MPHASENSNPVIRILQRNLVYSPDTGLLTWKINKRGRRFKAGDEAGYTRQSKCTSYRMLNICGEKIFAHIAAWAMYYDEWPINEIDHEDGNGLNNAILNLRDVTHAVNVQNQRMHSNNKSGSSGVRWFEGSQKWRTEIKSNGRTVHLGLFNTIEEASQAYQKAKESLGYHHLHGTVKQTAH